MLVKILSWNIWFNGYFDEMTQFLKRGDFDVIGLQEVVENEKERDTIAFLAGLGYHHVFSPAFMLEKDGRIVGNAIFSKYEIVRHAIHELPSAAPNTFRTENRSAVSADINVGGTTLHVRCTHLLHTHQQTSEIQAMQVTNLMKVLPQDHTIVMGDFNATPESPIIQKMSAAFINTDPSFAPTWGQYPEGCNVCKPQSIDTRLDYIFTSKDIVIHSPIVETSRASDHLPISVMVEL